MSIGTVNALIASHHFVVPSALDSLSTRAAQQFVPNMLAIKRELDLDLDLAGIVGMMSRKAELDGREIAIIDQLRAAARLWGTDDDLVFKKTIPIRQGIAEAAGESLAYFGKDSEKKPLKDLFDPLFADIAERIVLTNH